MHFSNIGALAAQMVKPFCTTSQYILVTPALYGPDQKLIEVKGRLPLILVVIRSDSEQPSKKQHMSINFKVATRLGFGYWR